MSKIDSKAAAKIIRAIMQAHGKLLVYNNLYAKYGTRSIKCYGTENQDCEMVWSIARALNALDFPFKIKFTTPKRRWAWPGVIVKMKV